jgi:hypothetical protein
MKAEKERLFSGLEWRFQGENRGIKEWMEEWPG